MSPNDDGLTCVTPLVEGLSLISLVTVFETRQHFDVIGGYGGLVPSSYRFGDLRRYYLGTATSQSPEPGHAWLLGCDCGEVGCWPLSARIVLTQDTVVWDDFAQEHRKLRVYTGLGPFVFDRNDYERTVVDMINALPA